MFYVIDKNGSYQEINAQDAKSAIANALLRYTAAEAAELEIELIDESSDKTVCTWEDWQ